MNTELWQTIDELIFRSLYDKAIGVLEQKIKAQNVDEFNTILDCEISNSKEDILASINSFIENCQKKFEVKSIYIEMNGFDINYDRWYFDYFGYSSYIEDPEDLDWLCDWNSDHWPETTIEGMEPAQKVFEWYHSCSIYETHPEYKYAYDAAMLLIMVKFSKYISEAIRLGSVNKNLPVLATAHGFDTISRTQS